MRYENDSNMVKPMLISGAYTCGDDECGFTLHEDGERPLVVACECDPMIEDMLDAVLRARARRIEKRGDSDGD